MDNMTNNRVEVDIQKWLERENGIRILFRPNTTNERYFLKAKLEHFDKLYQAYRGSASTEEKFTLQLLRGEAKHLKKILYPSVIERAGRDLAKLLSSIYSHISGAKARLAAKQLQKEYLTANPIKVNSQSIDNGKVKNVPSLNKGQQNKKVNKHVAEIDLLPKLKTHNGKGIKVK